MATPARLVGDASSVLSPLLTFASTAALALPEPIGALASGGLAVLNMIFGEGDGSTDQTIRNALAAALSQFQSQSYSDEIQDQTAVIETAAHWLSIAVQTLQDTGDMDNGASMFASNLLAKVGDTDSPTSTLPTALTTLNDPRFLNDPTVGQDAYAALKYGIGLYLTFLRLQVQMQSWQVANNQGSPGATDLNYGWFDTYRLETEYWGGILSTIIDQQEGARLAMVGPVTPNEVKLNPLNGNPMLWNYNFLDTGPRPPAAGSPPVDGWSGTDFAASPGLEDIIAKSDSNRDRNAYIAFVQGVLDQTYQPDQQGISTWIDNLQTWEQALVPLTPQSAPALSSPWGASTPQGANWVSGANVQYAVTYANNAGQSPLGPQCDPIPITTQAFPTLTLPVDPMQLASARHIHRQFLNGASSVFIVADNTTTTWQDQNP